MPDLGQGQQVGTSGSFLAQRVEVSGGVRTQAQCPTIEDIQRAVVERFSIRSADMTSTRRARVVVRPRQVAMYLAKQLTPRSFPEIGRMFGNRHHTTVMHAVAHVAELMSHDAALAEDVELLRRILGS